MKRSDIPADVTDAKREAVETLLADTRSPRRHATSIVRAHPAHNVVGIGVGRKIKRGRTTKTLSVRVYVERKLPEHLIHPDHLLPKEFGGVVTDVIEAGRFSAHLSAPAGQQRRRPARPGCSIGFRFPDAQAGELMAGTMGALVSAEPVEAADDMQVEKTGRATGYTMGTVFDVSATVPIDFDLGKLTFEDQILVRGQTGAFSDGGDSGSLIVDRESGRATGLLMGGSPQFAIANHIGEVLEALNVTLVC
jgi:hypothetical protein